MRSNLLSSIIVFLVAAAVSAAPAAADLPSCDDAQPASLVWSWPPKNATDIPTNAVILAIPSRGQPLTVEFDGRDLAPDGTGGLAALTFNPGPLNPNTEYTIVFQIGAGATSKKVLSKFTTGGAELGEAPEGPAVNGYSDVTEPQDPACAGVLAAQACFTGATASHLRLDLVASGVAWTVREAPVSGPKSAPILWPATCQAEAFTQPGEAVDPGICYELVSLDAAGNESEPITLCPYQSAGSGDTGGGRGGGGGSCGVSAHPATGWAPGSLLLLALLGLLGLPGRRAAS